MVERNKSREVRVRWWLPVAAALAPLFAGASAEPPRLAFIGTTTSLLNVTAATQEHDPAGQPTYFGGTPILYGKGIYAVDADRASGRLSRLRLAAATPNPIWLTVEPRRNVLYAGSGDFDGGISVFRINSSTGDLAPLGHRGNGLIAHMTIDPSGRFLLAADFIKAAVQVYPIEPDGNLGTMVHEAVMSGKPAYNHMVGFDQSGRFVLAADYGLDRLYIWRFDPSSGALTPNSQAYYQMERGSGPRHFAISPDNRRLYLLEEHSSTVRVFDMDVGTAALTLRERQHLSSVASGFAGISVAAELLLSRDGRNLYATNRQHDTVASFAVEQTGEVTFLGEDHTGDNYPRGAAFGPDGRALYALNERGSSVTLFRIDRRSGRATAAGQSLLVPTPLTMVFAPDAPETAK